MSWDEIDPQLARLAAQVRRPESSRFRLCEVCNHRHAPSELCGYQVGNGSCTCRR